MLYKAFFKMVTYKPSVGGIPIERVYTPQNDTREEFISIENELPAESVENSKERSKKVDIEIDDVPLDQIENDIKNDDDPDQSEMIKTIHAQLKNMGTDSSTST